MRKQNKKLVLLMLFFIISIEVIVILSADNSDPIKSQKIRISEKPDLKTTSNGYGIEICTADKPQLSPAMCEDGNGGAIIAWFDRRDEDTYYDIYVQNVDSNGNVKWSTNGKQIHNASSFMYYELQIWSDGTGGAILSWKESASLMLMTYKIYVQKIDADGNALWEEEGLNISNNSIWYPLQLCCDGSGGVFLEWQAGGNFHTQRIHSNGTILWTNVCHGYRPSICTDTLGGVIVTWYDIDVDENIYAQKFNTNGNALWGENGTVICNAESDQSNPWICSDGVGGAFITWFDERLGSFSIGTYAQKVDDNGNCLWENNGTVLSGFYREMKPDGEGGMISYYRDYNEDEERSYIYGQKINSTGNKLWGENGTIITSYEDPDVITSVEFCSDGEGGAIYMWQFKEKWSIINPSVSALNTTDIYAQKINKQGKAVWQGNGLGVCVPASNYRSHSIVFDICKDGKGGAIITYEFIKAKYESEYSHVLPYLWDIHAQLINSGGQLQWNIPPNIWLIVTIGVIIGGSAVAVIITIVLLKKRRTRADL